ncbi:MAG: hypothetical protein IT204_03065 [Fimbriimonadaceae bacterium]|nr:hypothetical protein [Fimbriimonadaceae bacterium]
MLTEKVVLLGAGSASFTRGLLTDILQRGWQGELGLVDPDPDALAVASGLARKMIAAAGSALQLSAATDRREVLPDASAVICTVGVGGRRAWEQDVYLPRQFGIYQPVGDTVMPGGTSRALRMIPAMVDIARDVLELAPHALFINYGNPMSPVCRGIAKATGAPVIGLCHGVFHVGQYLARALDVPLEELRYEAVGINHLTWFTALRRAGQDLLPRLLELADSRRDGAEEPFAWHLTRLCGAFPAVLDRHISEFFPWLFPGGAYYGQTLGVDAFSFEECIASGDRRYAEMRELALGPQPLSADFLQRTGGEHEQVTAIIESIRGDCGVVYSANLPNRGQVPNLPAEAVIESPCLATGAGLQPIQQPPLAAVLAGTLATRFQWVETVVEAALEGSRLKFVQALLLDGAVPSLDTAERLADALLAAQAAWLPQFAQ